MNKELFKEALEEAAKHGLILVPVEPTPEMLEAGHNAPIGHKWPEGSTSGEINDWLDVLRWKAMIAAYYETSLHIKDKSGE